MAKEREQDSAFRETVDKLEKGGYIFGYSHVQCSYLNTHKGIYLISPGSCGLPLDGIKDSIPYTILEIGNEGQFSKILSNAGREEIEKILK